MSILFHTSEAMLAELERDNVGKWPGATAIVSVDTLLDMVREIRRLVSMVGPQVTSGDPDPQFVPAPPPPLTRGQVERLVASLRERAGRAGKRGYYDTDLEALQGDAVQQALEEVADALEHLITEGL